MSSSVKPNSLVCNNIKMRREAETLSSYAALRTQNGIRTVNQDHLDRITPILAASNVEKNFFNHNLLVPDLFQIGNNLVLAQFECMKNYPAFYFINAALRDGRLNYGDTVIESSSGSFAYGLAQAWSNRINPYTGKKDNKLVISTDVRVGQDFVESLEQLGAEVLVTHEKEKGGYQIPRLRRLREKMAEVQAATGKLPLWTNQYDNTDLQNAYAPLARHLDKYARRCFRRPVDIIVATVGTGCSASGIAKTLKALNPGTMAVFVDTQGSAILGKKVDKSKYMIGLGNSIICGNNNYDMADFAHWVDTGQSIHAMLELHGMGVDAGFSTGTAYHVAKWLARNNPDKNVFMIGPDNGERYLPYMTDPAWQAEYGIQVASADAPEEISCTDIIHSSSNGWHMCAVTDAHKRAMKSRRDAEVADRQAEARAAQLQQPCTLPFAQYKTG